MRRWASWFGGKSLPQADLRCDYRSYQLSRREWLRCVLEGAVGSGVLVYIFYRSFVVWLLFLPAILIWPYFCRKNYAKKRQEELRLQFKEAIQILAASLSAGYAVENAFAAGVRELKELYGEDAMITREFSYLSHQLSMNRTAEALLLDFAKRSGLDEVKQFAEIFAVAKRSRGELVSVADHVVHILSERISVQQEILTMTAEKRLEQRIMNGMPCLIVFYVDMTSPGFFSPMYETTAGRLVMTGCFLVYLLSLLLAARILEIEW